jgi:hypothetical protein
MGYSDERDIRIARRNQLSQLEKALKIYPATITSESGSTTYTDLGLNFTWVSLWGREDVPPVPAWNPTALTEKGTPVFIARNPKNPYRWEIIGINSSYELDTSSNPTNQFNLPNHAPNHQIPTEATKGPDPYYAFQPALKMLKTEGDNISLTVRTDSYIYNKNSTRRYFAGKLTDLTSYIPGSGLIRKVLLYLDRNANLLYVVAGAAVTDDGVTPIPEPTPPAGADAKMSAFVILANGQTVVTTATDVLDCRDTLGGSDATYLLPEPTEQGQVLMVDEALNWIAAIPLTDDDGGWMTDDSGMLMIDA